MVVKHYSVKVGLNDHFQEQEPESNAQDGAKNSIPHGNFSIFLIFHQILTTTIVLTWTYYVDWVAFHQVTDEMFVCTIVVDVGLRNQSLDINGRSIIRF